MQQGSGDGPGGFDVGEMHRYWRTLSTRLKGIDRTTDRDALGIVCHTDRPLWFNRFVGRIQRRTFLALLGRLPIPRGARALDVGCGGGRWSRLLRDRGLDVVGIDLQPETIEANRRLMPDIDFRVQAVEDLEADGFDLAVSVTVIQHLPIEAQRQALAVLVYHRQLLVRQ